MDPVGALVEQLRTCLRRFRKPGPLVVAISGGSDSTALLTGLSRLRTDPAFAGFSLHAVTIDHGLRAGSAEEAEAVAALCKRLAIHHRIRCWQGEKPETGLQAAARAARYRLLAHEARALEAAALLTGHSADDQRETIAMRAARGEGDGLSGMAEQTLIEEDVWLVRPLLALDRQTMRTALLEWGEPWLDDPSNDNPRFERVRRRREGIAARDFPERDRARTAEAQAKWLDAHVQVTAGAVARVSSISSVIGQDDASLALFRLSSAIGGKVHLPPVEARLRIVGWLQAGEPGRKTLGGTVFDLRRDALWLYRESRGLLPKRLQVDGDLYDGRYLLCGPPQGQALAGPVSDREEAIRGLEAGGVPTAIAKRAAPALVALDPAVSGFRLERRIAAQRHFLPGFDLKVAQSLRQHFGLPVLPVPPLSASLR